MPTKTPAKKQIAIAARNPKPTRNKKRWLMWGIPIAAVLIGVFLYWVVGGGGMSEQAKMATYLKEKYGQEFAVENVRVTGSGLGVEGSVRADAYPKSDPSLKFELRRPEERSEYDYDSFLDELWSRQEREQVDKFVKDLGGVRSYDITIRTSVNFSNKLHGYTPSFSDIREKGESAFSYSLNVRSEILGGNNEPSDAELVRAFKVMDFVKSRNSVDPAASYTYKGNGFIAPDGKDYDQYIISVEGKDTMSGVRRADDLKKYFDLTYTAKEENIR